MVFYFILFYLYFLAILIFLCTLYVFSLLLPYSRRTATPASMYLQLIQSKTCNYVKISCNLATRTHYRSEISLILSYYHYIVAILIIACCALLKTARTTWSGKWLPTPYKLWYASALPRSQCTEPHKCDDSSKRVIQAVSIFIVIACCSSPHSRPFVWPR